MRRLTTLGLTGALTALAALTAAPPAEACGGFFCNGQTQTPIYQAGERVLFARDGETVTMHVEVTYQGDPTEFAWILPVPDRPMDAQGNPLPLDEAVGISLPELFDRLQTRTDPTFTMNRSRAADWDACNRLERDRFSGNPMMRAADASTSMDTTSGRREPEPPVTILSEAEIGPYDAQLIEATGSDQLYDWLNDHGYYQDPKAKPLLAHYVSQGFKFIGVKLHSGAETADIKPLVLRLGENAPCVPLRLTSIAATPDMPILVWVLGEGRAVPKNFIHAEVDPRAITWPSATDYVDRVTDAIDTAQGRAWVTEFAGPAGAQSGIVFPNFAIWSEADLETASTLPELLDATPSPLKLLAGWAELLTDEISTPSRSSISPGELVGSIDYWAQQHEQGNLELIFDLDRLKARIETELWEPAQAIEKLFAPEAGRTLTRFFTTIDPEAMTRDPIFAFNPSLPAVDNQNVVAVVLHRTNAEGECGEEWFEATYPDGSKWIATCSEVGGCGLTLPPAPGAKPLKVLSVADETGDPVPFDPAVAEEVDAILDNAVVGQPTLPPGTQLEPPEAHEEVILGPSMTANGPRADSGCSGAGDGAPAPLAVVIILLALGVVRRRA